MATLKSVDTTLETLAHVQMVVKAFRKRELLSMQLAIDNEGARLKVIPCCVERGCWSGEYREAY